MTEKQEEEKILYLVPGSGKDVRLYFNAEKTKLEKVRLSLNKVSEILSNGFINETEFLSIQTIGLITRSNFKTVVHVHDIKSTLIDPDTVNVTVDTLETNQKFKETNKSLLGRPYFEFFIDKKEKISHGDLYNLSKKNEETLKQIKKRKKKETYFTSLAKNSKKLVRKEN
ncbi:hypothetical protein [Enterococcus faecalis]|uniref:hypothetical protein n=1 Tax=Enterococcus faecalis TaxID=1351 RepID=UPI002DB89A5A|nr:hypothetical protein [Enterococcus faecalis]MEB7792068.1 hypothetical protein [Enterococcus faecalis]MEB7810056.1 hypothetical protein [Enterococcus faecalis]